MPSNKTVRDLKNQVLAEAGKSSHWEFLRISDNHGNFWDKLCKIGWDKAKKPVECDDMDATALLTEIEYNKLLTEFRRL